MNFDDAINALAEARDMPADAIGWLAENWDASAPACRAMLDAFVSGRDPSERTSQALLYIVALLADAHDQAAFPTICRLLHDPDQANLVFGDDLLTTTVPTLLHNAYDGDPAPLYALVRDPAVDGMVRADVMLLLGYMVRTARLPEAELYAFLSRLPAELEPRAGDTVWFGWVRIVAAMGFAGIAAQAETLFRDGWVDDSLLNLPEFWSDLNDSRADPGTMTSRAWDGLALADSALDTIAALFEQADGVEGDVPLAEPVRNPLRGVGRNDPCPCGSGKKYKKCCLVE